MKTVKPPASRLHTVSLLTQTAAALKECKPAGEYALSTTGGTKPLAVTTLSRWAQSDYVRSGHRMQARLFAH